MTLFMKTAKSLADNSVIKEKDIDICRYGLEVMFSTFIEFASIFIISAFVGNFIETLVFFAAFVPLRIYAGGYHADTKFRCYIISLVVYGMFSLILSAMNTEYFILTGVISVALTLAVVITFAPIIHKNRNVNAVEKIRYRKFSVSIVLIETLVSALLFSCFKSDVFGLSFSLGQAAVSLSMLAAIIKTKIN